MTSWRQNPSFCCLVSFLLAVFSVEGSTNLMRDTRLSSPLPNRQDRTVGRPNLRQPPATTIFKSGPNYFYRIPALIALDGGAYPRQQKDKDVILAFAERRNGTSQDTGDIDVVTRRSDDGGKTWSEEVTICDFGNDACGNPTVVEDTKGRVHLLLMRNPADSDERSPELLQRTVWASRSSDQGRSWEPPRDITDSTKLPSWDWYATGPGHGTRLQYQKDPSRNGRMVVPCDHSVFAEAAEDKQVYQSHVILSDDDGENWRIGGNITEEVQEQSNEASLVERGDGLLLLNARNHVSTGITDNRTFPRLLTRSTDGGASWLLEHANDLVAPDCEGSMTVARTTKRGSVQGGHPILFSHPSTADRHNLMISWSDDGGRTWPSNKTLLVYQGSSGYSDLATSDDGTVLVLYERGLEGIHLQSLLPVFLF